MNGGMTECTKCDCDPCICAEITKHKQQQRILDGKIVIESLWQVMSDLPRWKRKIIKWFWPDIIQVADDLREYYWS